MNTEYKKIIEKELLNIISLNNKMFEIFLSFDPATSNYIKIGSLHWIGIKKSYSMVLKGKKYLMWEVNVPGKYYSFISNEDILEMVNIFKKKYIGLESYL